MTRNKPNNVAAGDVHGNGWKVIAESEDQGKWIEKEAEGNLQRKRIEENTEGNRQREWCEKETEVRGQRKGRKYAADVKEQWKEPNDDAAIKSYKDLTIKNDFMFCKIISNDAILCRDFIQVCIGKPVGNITYDNSQQVFKVTSDGHGVRMDVYAEDDLNQAFDVEMENRNTGAYPERTLYYLGMMTRRQLHMAESYLNLRDNYVIFIMPFNLFPEIGLHRYTFVNRCIEAPEATLNDRNKRIFICTKGKNRCGKSERNSITNERSTEQRSITKERSMSEEPDIPEDLQALLLYIETGRISNDLTKRLDDAVQKAKSNREWEAEYVELCEKYREYRELGREEGREEGRAEGREEGRAEGREEGRAEGREEGRAEVYRDVWRAMYKDGFSIEDISKYTNTPVKTIKDFLASSNI